MRVNSSFYPTSVNASPKHVFSARNLAERYVLNNTLQSLNLNWQPCVTAKCDGVQPYCGTCRTQGVVCTWSEVSTRRGPPKGYRRGAADPLSLLPKIAKIREQVQALQVAYGEKAVKEELHKSIWGIPTCDYVSVPGTPSCSTSSGACTATATSHMRSESPHHSRERKHEWGHEEIDGKPCSLIYVFYNSPLYKRMQIIAILTKEKVHLPGWPSLPICVTSIHRTAHRSRLSPMHHCRNIAHGQGENA